MHAQNEKINDKTETMKNHTETMEPKIIIIELKKIYQRASKTDLIRQKNQ